MIKVNKDYATYDIPASLRLPVAANFVDGRVIPQAAATQRKRGELLAAAGYINGDKYNDRYKLDDIREALINIYHSKCAFCEQHIEQYHIEHYRPKQIYYWLAFSWDNLLMACPKCNEYKGTNFSLATGNPATLQPGLDINIQSYLHDISEQPYLVNPEKTDPLGSIYFSKNGCIDSDDARFYYTVKTCKIDRKDLNDNRSKIWNDFREHLNAEKLINPGKNALLNTAINTLSRTFIRDSENISNEFLAFRKYAIDNWLRDEIKAILK